jgi:hypothetical protein
VINVVNTTFREGKQGCQATIVYTSTNYDKDLEVIASNRQQAYSGVQDSIKFDDVNSNTIHNKTADYASHIASNLTQASAKQKLNEVADNEAMLERLQQIDLFLEQYRKLKFTNVEVQRPGEGGYKWTTSKNVEWFYDFKDLPTIKAYIESMNIGTVYYGDKMQELVIVPKDPSTIPFKNYTPVLEYRDENGKRWKYNLIDTPVSLWQEKFIRTNAPPAVQLKWEEAKDIDCMMYGGETRCDVIKLIEDIRRQENKSIIVPFTGTIFTTEYDFYKCRMEWQC